MKSWPEQKEILTERLIMRPLNPSDAHDLYLLNLDPDVLRYTGDSAFSSVADAHSFLESYTQYINFGLGRFSVMSRSDNVFLGWCGLKKDDDGRIDLGYRFHKRYWGKGYATESARAQLAYGFIERSLNTIIAKAIPENTASIQVMKKLGMTYQGRERDIDVFVDIYCLEKIDYMAAQQSET